MNEDKKLNELQKLCDAATSIEQWKDADDLLMECVAALGYYSEEKHFSALKNLEQPPFFRRKRGN